jgi:transposase InsO family protein
LGVESRTTQEAVVAHAKAALTPLGRRLLVDRVLVHGWTVAAAAESMGVSRATGHKWLRRWREEGEAGLQDRSSRPVDCPTALSAARTTRICDERDRTGWGPHRLAALTGECRSTVHRVLQRAGKSRLSDLDPLTGQVIRYQRDRPGELLHVDVKKFAPIPDGGGHKKLGRTTQARALQTAARKTGRPPTLFLHTAVDDRTRVAFVQLRPSERADQCTAFLADALDFFAGIGAPVERVMTDNAKNYVLARSFQQLLTDRQVRHVRIKPYCPRTNGKVERFHLTLAREWAYVTAYDSETERLSALPAFVAWYNSARPHTALDGRPPMQALADVNNVLGHYT